MKRREFMTTLSGLGILSAAPNLFSTQSPGGSASTPAKMAYRRLGRTGLRISAVSLGGSPVPNESVFRLAMDRGVNYVDTSSSYMNGNSESIIGRLIADRRDRFIVATKFHPGRRYRSTAGLIEEAEGSLRRLNSDYIDVLLVHGARDPDLLKADYVLEAFAKLKQQGKIRFTGVSCHHDPVRVLLPAIESGHYDMISLAYNVYSGSRVEEGGVYTDYLQEAGISKILNAASQKDLGVIAMKVMAGGERQELSRFRAEGVSPPQAKIKWVLADQRVSGIITEMLNFNILQENLGALAGPITQREQACLNRHVKKNSATYCRMCGICESVCPQGIAISDIMRYSLYYRGYGKTREARTAYRSLSLRATVAGCTQCGLCETHCPYDVAVLRNLETAYRLLA
ncbi:MAG TPA: hypothetical protein ENN40_02250 [Candidatus Aminicenantes bacterium]|nr:hypothetical protein [Candidatus Aminicenantes bacterium]